MEMRYLKGSEWRKWDLHVHTPDSIVHNYQKTESLDAWDKFIDDIEHLPSDIKVLGINDYLFLDGYRKILKYRDNGRLKNIDLFLPVIEFRLSKFAGHKSFKRINFHVIFSDQISPDIIQAQFLNALNSKYTLTPGINKDIWSGVITRESLEDLGAKIKASVSPEKLGDYGSNLIEGFNNLNLDIIQIKEALKKADTYFHNKYLTAIGKTEWDAFNWGDSSIAEKKEIINDVDIVFTAAEDIDSHKKGKAKLQEQRVNALLLDCSDAHHNIDSTDKDRLGNCYTWIKADPTFEGLRQIIYEPEDRVKIQISKPDYKNPKHIIAGVRLSGKKMFGEQTLQFNENLTSIIGGKSSGKSLLLHMIAQSIDKDMVRAADDIIGFKGYDFKEEYNCNVLWESGETDTLFETSYKEKIHKITYIPQLYINHLAEKDKKSLNQLVLDILDNNEEFSAYYSTTTNAINQITAQIDIDIFSFLDIRRKAIEISAKIKEHGTSEMIQNSIKSIEDKIAEIQKISNFTKEEIESYTQLTSDKDKAEKEIRNIQQKQQLSSTIQAELVKIKSHLFGNAEHAISGSLYNVALSAEPTPEDILTIIKELETKYQKEFLDNFSIRIESLQYQKSIEHYSVLTEGIKQQLKPFEERLEKQEDVKKLTQMLEEEKKKQDDAANLEKNKKQLLEEYIRLKKVISENLANRYKFYQDIILKINEKWSDIGVDIKLTANLSYSKYSLPLYDQVNKVSVGKDDYFNKLFQNDQVNYPQIPELFMAIKKLNGKVLETNGKGEILMRDNADIESIFKGLCIDNFVIDFNIHYNKDEITKMSPGKRGTVLLILYLELSSSEYPILIDQPEDNLDNRTIYNSLCKMIRAKKKDRQIIMVSHNANLVVSTDSECVIVAHQLDSVDEESHKFEYYEGSLEYSFEKDDSILNILNKQGIREHVCDILEGGEEAFAKRQNKYNFI